jgi:hypothetical protein
MNYKRKRIKLKMRARRRLNFENVEDDVPSISYSTIVDVKSKPSETESKVDIVFAFDTTGSMKSVLQSVRNNLVTTVDRLFSEVEGIHIGICTFGDYCDAPNVCWKLNPTTDKEAIKNCIITSPDTCGGDAEECYEYIIHLAHSKIEWKSDIKIFVLIGDENPHEVGYYLPKKCKGINDELEIDWKEESKKCREKNISIFTCHALAKYNQHSVSFYKKVSNITRGYYFELDELNAFNDYMVGICCKVGDVVEDFQSIKERYNQLKREKMTTNDTNEKIKLEKEIKESEELFLSLQHESLFTSPLLKREKAKTNSQSKRLTSYSQEINNESFDKFMNQSE